MKAGGACKLRLAVFAMGLVAVMVSPIRAAQSDESVTFTGQVIDTYEGVPVVGVAVRLMTVARADGSAVMGVTNDSGHFAIANVPPGPSRIAVSRIGYADLYQVLDIQGGQVVEIAIVPKPVVLEGIEVYVDRLTSRLRSLPYLTSTFDNTKIRLEPDVSVAGYLHSQPGFEFVPCFVGQSAVGMRIPPCIRTRGTVPQRPRVFIDDAPAFGGVTELTTLPTTEIYRIEVIRGCGQIRVYTISYVEGMAANRHPVLPIVC